MIDQADLRRYERLALPHLDAAYNLARWLTRDEQDAQDVVQEAMLRALRYFAAFRGDNARPWLLTIVRHTCYGWLRENRPAQLVSLDGGDDADAPAHDPPAPDGDEPQVAAARRDEHAQVNRALAALPVAYREVLVLRELEDLSYRDIAAIVQVPVGTVMSRLARARSLLRAALEPDARPNLRPVPRAANEDARS